MRDDHGDPSRDRQGTPGDPLDLQGIPPGSPRDPPGIPWGPLGPFRTALSCILWKRNMLSGAPIDRDFGEVFKVKPENLPPHYIDIIPVHKAYIMYNLSEVIRQNQLTTTSLPYAPKQGNDTITSAHFELSNCSCNRLLRRTSFLHAWRARSTAPCHAAQATKGFAKCTLQGLMFQNLDPKGLRYRKHNNHSRKHLLMRLTQERLNNSISRTNTK